MAKRNLMEFVERGERILAEIDQIFLDAEHWNRHVRKPHEFPIAADPDGELENARMWLRSFIHQAPRPLRPLR